MPIALRKSGEAALQCLEIFSGNGSTRNAISVPGIDVWISSDPFKGHARGGDIHYVSTCGGGEISRFALLDVAGHGATVAQLGRRLRALMRKYMNTLDQARYARALNRDFLRLARSGRFATALLTTYHAPTDRLTVCNAGHPRPLWYRAEERVWTVLDSEPGQHAETTSNLPLGIMEPADYTEFSVRLGKGDLVLLYSDALIESADTRGRPLGEGGLLDLVRGLGPAPPDDLNQRLRRAVGEHRGGGPAQDDETLLLLHHNAADPPGEAGAVDDAPESLGRNAA